VNPLCGFGWWVASRLTVTDQLFTSFTATFMSAQLLPAIIGFIGLIIGAIPTYVYMRQRKLAEVGKLHAETDKIKAEAEKIRAEFQIATTLQQPRVKVLFVAADPGDFPKLRLGDEIRGISRALRTSRYGDNFILEQLWAARWTDLRTELLRNSPDVLHISGHASKDGLLFEDDRGDGQPVPTDQLAALLSLFSDRLRLVLINTMQVENLCEALARSIDYVIGTTGLIADEQAINFSSAFYEALADGKSIQVAFDFALANVRTDKGGYKLVVERKAAPPHLLLKAPPP
jgi:CHAT domain-containing protein